MQGGRAIAQDVNCRTLTAEARIRARVSPCGICGGQGGNGTGISASSSDSPCLSSFHHYSILIYHRPMSVR
jgi:hypothetical protein